MESLFHFLSTADEPGSCFQWVGVDCHKILRNPKPTISVCFCHRISSNCHYLLLNLCCTLSWQWQPFPDGVLFTSPAVHICLVYFAAFFKRSDQICAHCATFLYVLCNKGQSHFLFSLARCLLFIHC